MKKIVLVFCLALGSCSAPDKGAKLKELRINSHAEPPTLDVRRATDTTGINIIRMSLEGLTVLRNSGIEMAMAERYETDGITYTFFLRDAKWSDGHPVTARDFEATWQKMLDPLFPCPFANDMYVLKNAKAFKEGKCPVSELGVKALDEKTLQIIVEHPAPHLLKMLASHSFYPTPIHVEEKNYPYVANGPFKLVEWHPFQEIVVDKNPLYWDKDAVKLDRIRVAVVEDENTEFTMFENDELDWIGSPYSSLPLDALKTIRHKYNLEPQPMAGVYYYIFNTTIYPFNNVNLRRALSLAVNRQDLIENVLQGGQTPAMAFVPPMTDYEPSKLFKDADKDEAQKFFNLALKELGLKSADELPPLVLSYNTADAHHKIAQAIQEQWSKAFGVKVKLENMEWKVFLDQVHNKKFQVARMGGVASFDDPITFLTEYQYMDGNNNHSGWTNQTYTDLITQADMCLDGAERLNLLRQAEKVLIDEMPIAPMYFYTQSCLKKPGVNGGKLSLIGEIDVKSLSLEEK